MYINQEATRYLWNGRSDPCEFKEAIYFITQLLASWIFQACENVKLGKVTFLFPWATEVFVGSAKLAKT